MSSVALGAGAACAASCLYNAGLALQATEARRTDQERRLRPSLLTGLLRRPRWLAGTGMNLLGWPLQAAALLLAPLAVVQPGLAFGRRRAARGRAGAWRREASRRWSAVPSWRWAA